MRKGIAVAGTAVTDVIKTIDIYPAKGMLANVLSIHRAVGGCVPNTAIDLAVIDPSLAVYALGCVGDDENGRFVKEQMRQYGVNVSGMTQADEVTGFTDVMTVADTGERTFFARRGCNDRFDLQEEYLRSTNIRILHVGYVTMLGHLDAPDAAYGTVLARRLKTAQEQGIVTSMDLVSAQDKVLRETALPALTYCDYVIWNETEACAVADIAARDEKGRLLVDNIRTAMQRLLERGVKKAVVVHCPEAGFMRTADGKEYTVPSLSLPQGYIKGSVGAGDAFCAACLYGFYTSLAPQEILEFASAAAACNLSAADAVSGMRCKKEIYEVCKKYGRRKSTFIA